jgi:hypothetical protein
MNSKELASEKNVIDSSIAWIPVVCGFHHRSISSSMFLVARIGFDPVTYNFDEGDGTGFFTFRVLQGNITFPVSVLFSTSDGSATGMKFNICYDHF